MVVCDWHRTITERCAAFEMFNFNKITFVAPGCPALFGRWRWLVCVFRVGQPLGYSVGDVRWRPARTELKRRLWRHWLVPYAVGRPVPRRCPHPPTLLGFFVIFIRSLFSSSLFQIISYQILNFGILKKTSWTSHGT